MNLSPDDRYPQTVAIAGSMQNLLLESWIRSRIESYGATHSWTDSLRRAFVSIASRYKGGLDSITTDLDAEGPHPNVDALIQDVDTFLTRLLNCPNPLDGSATIYDVITAYTQLLKILRDPQEIDQRSKIVEYVQAQEPTVDTHRWFQELGDSLAETIKAFSLILAHTVLHNTEQLGSFAVQNALIPMLDGFRMNRAAVAEALMTIQKKGAIPTEQPRTFNAETFLRKHWNNDAVWDIVEAALSAFLAQTSLQNPTTEPPPWSAGWTDPKQRASFLRVWRNSARSGHVPSYLSKVIESVKDIIVDPDFAMVNVALDSYLVRALEAHTHQSDRYFSDLASAIALWQERWSMNKDMQTSPPAASPNPATPKRTGMVR